MESTPETMPDVESQRRGGLARCRISHRKAAAETLLEVSIEGNFHALMSRKVSNSHGSSQPCCAVGDRRFPAKVLSSQRASCVMPEHVRDKLWQVGFSSLPLTFFWDGRRTLSSRPSAGVSVLGSGDHPAAKQLPFSAIREPAYALNFTAGTRLRVPAGASFVLDTSRDVSSTRVHMSFRADHDGADPSTVTVPPVVLKFGEYLSRDSLADRRSGSVRDVGNRRILLLKQSSGWGLGTSQSRSRWDAPCLVINKTVSMQSTFGGLHASSGIRACCTDLVILSAQN